MASLSDVKNTLVGLALNAVYPNGTNNPSVANVDVRLYQGWPVKSQLDADLSAGKAHISVFAGNTERNSTRFSRRWETVSINPPTLTLTANANNNTVVVGGAVSTNQTCMVIVNQVGYTYVVQANDTLNSVALGIANAIPGASVVGAVVTIPNAHSLTTNISTIGTSVSELKRQERQFMVTVWTSNPTVRDSLSDALEITYEQNYRYSLPDGTTANLKYQSTREDDSEEKSRIYIRHFYYLVEYATTQTQTNYTIAQSYVNSVSSGQTGQITP